MGVSWGFSEEIHIERRPDQIIIRSQWGQLIPSIVFGACFIAGLVWIMQANGMLAEDHWHPFEWTGVSILISAGFFIMLPRRLTVSFDARTRKAVRVYQLAFGLITRRREISFDDIACVAVQTGRADGETFYTLAIRRRDDEVISLAMREGSRDDLLRAAETISSATGIALEAA